MGSVSENRGGINRRREDRDVHLDVGWVDEGAVNGDPAEMTVNLNCGWSPHPNRIGCILSDATLCFSLQTISTPPFSKHTKRSRMMHTIYQLLLASHWRCCLQSTIFRV